MTFIARKDLLNDRITVHKFPCPALGDLHENPASYKEFSEFDYAEQYAEENELQICLCADCGVQQYAHSLKDAIADRTKNTEKRWGIYSTPGDYNRIHAVDSECTRKQGMRIVESFNTFDDAVRCVKSAGLKYVPYAVCGICKDAWRQESMRKKQAADLPGIIGRIVMEKKTSRRFCIKSCWGCTNCCKSFQCNF